METPGDEWQGKQKRYSYFLHSSLDTLLLISCPGCLARFGHNLPQFFRFFHNPAKPEPNRILIGAAPRGRPQNGQPRGVAPTVCYHLAHNLTFKGLTGSTSVSECLGPLSQLLRCHQPLVSLPIFKRSISDKSIAAGLHLFLIASKSVFLAVL